MEMRWEQVELGLPVATTMPVRFYEPPVKEKAPPLVLYLRGGAFQQEGTAERDTPIARALANGGAIVVEADYGSISQNMFPGAVECGLAALRCLAARRRKLGSARSLILIAGEEAGGNVAAGIALKARDQMPGVLAGQVLLSPLIDPTMSSVSIRKADAIGMRERWSDGWMHYLRGFCGFTHPYAAPCMCSRLAAVAPALVVTAEDDPLRDETLGYADRLSEAGVKVRRHVFPAGSGWSGIYNEEDGAWLSEISAHFRLFVQELRR
ncbi:alpha/beta hydrolase [Pseudorhizobium halotolerans]|uniref:Alpha/beta hydrolase n=1 Tax=Pseudorhizobium halotolerans TaxID=1233081 RepID=A0ABM8PVU5_9HYPH|nr:alpha/beta hydrolase [Pseudorhizobium halotolerans]